MSKRDKLLVRLSNSNNTFPWSDLVKLLAQLGYDIKEMEGSLVRFYNATTNHMIRLHKPHPENTINGGAMKALRQALQPEGYL